MSHPPYDDPPPTRWGVLATGKIAHSFVADLREVPGAVLAAVGSRNLDSAREFAATHGDAGTRAHGSYEELVADPGVDVVYIATPHALHLANARLAFEAGKHVLCEKPLALSLDEGEEMVRLAAEHNRFLMEAMWMLCHPVVQEIKTRLDAGDFGVPRQVHADLGWVVDRPPTDRMLDPALGGGALLDMGCYPLAFAQLLLGPAEQLTAVADLTDTGVDRDVSIAGRYGGGAVAALTASMSSHSPRTASIATSTGRIDIERDFHHPVTATWTPYHQGTAGQPEPITSNVPVLGRGYGNEAAEVARCLADGLTESPSVPHAHTLSLMEQMDTLRRQVGVIYPSER